MRPQIHMRAVRAVAAFVTAGLLVTGPLEATATAAPDLADQVQVFGRDVFVIVGSTLRNPTVETPPEAALYTNTGIRIETSGSDPVTWGEWSAATAASRMNVLGGTKNPRTDVRLQMRGLIPGGNYSVFWGTLGPDSEQPLCPGVERTLPLDASHRDSQSPDLNSFVAASDGTAEFRGQVNGALANATQVFFSVVYHFLGDSSYPFPNIGEQRTQGANCRSSFGEDSMRHLLILQKW